MTVRHREQNFDIAEPYVETFLRVNAERLPNTTRLDQFRIKELVGNPFIETYRQGALVSSQSYRPLPKPVVEQATPLEIWLYMNNILLGSLQDVWG